jgi:methyl-accepting chemotaxis protein
MKMKIRTRLGLGFAAMLLLVIVTAVVGIVSLNRIGESMATVRKQADQSAELGSIHAGVLTYESNLLTTLENPSATSLLNAKVMLAGLNDEITDYEHPMRPEDLSMSEWSAAYPEAAQSCTAHCHVGPTLMAVEEKRVAFTKAAEECLAQPEILAPAGVQSANLPAAQKSIGSAAEALLLATDTMAQEQLGSLSRVQTLVGAIESSTRRLMFASAIAATILGVLLAITITRSITLPLANLVNVSDKISTGELDTPVPVAAKDEIGELAQSMERMRISIKALVERMRSRSGG